MPSPTRSRCRVVCGSTTITTTFRSDRGMSSSTPAPRSFRRASSYDASGPRDCAGVLLRLEPHRPVDPNDLAVQVTVLDEVLREGRVLVGPAQPLRERNV